MDGILTYSDGLSGTLSEVDIIEGELSPVGSMEGTLTIPTIIEAEAYDGDYEITPSEETQILMTAEKTAKGNITINPIPSNYGRITYNGSTITIS